MAETLVPENPGKSTPDKLDKGEISIIYLPTHIMLEEHFTKLQKGYLFQNLRYIIMIKVIPYTLLKTVLRIQAGSVLIIKLKWNIFHRKRFLCKSRFHRESQGYFNLKGGNKFVHMLTYFLKVQPQTNLKAEKIK